MPCGFSSPCSRRILPLAFLSLLLSFSACSSPRYHLEITADPNPVPAEFGKTTLTVRVVGDLPRGVTLRDLSLFSTAGTFTSYLLLSSRELTAELLGITDVSFSPVIIKARLGSEESFLRLTILSGKVARLYVKPDREIIVADEGALTLKVTPLDGAGNPVTLPGIGIALSQGRVERIESVEEGFSVGISGVHSASFPLIVTLSAQDLVTTATFPVVSGALDYFSVEILDPSIRSGVPFSISLRALDRYNNPRKDFSGFVYFSPYDLATRQRISISPTTSNLFLEGELMMSGVELGQGGKEIVFMVSTDPGGGGVTGSTPPFSVAPRPAQCVLVEPQAGSRVQSATDMGVPAGFTVLVSIYADPCTIVERNRQSPRLMDYTPIVDVYLADGTLWGSSLSPQTGQTVGPLKSDPANSRFTIQLYNLTRTSYSPVRVVATIGEIAGELQLQITPGPWRRIGFDPIPDQWSSGSAEIVTGVTVTTQPFVATLRALDLYGNTVVTESATLTCFSSSGTLDPTITGTLTLGTLNQPFSISGINQSEDVTITCARTGDNSISGSSNPFKVFPFPPPNPLDLVTDFLIVLPGQSFNPQNLNDGVQGDPTPQIAGEPFDVTIVARNLFSSCPGPNFSGDLYLGLLTNSQALSVIGSQPSPLTGRMSQVLLPLFCGTPFLSPPVAYSQVTATVQVTQAGNNIILVANPLNAPGTRSNIGFPSLSTAFTVLSSAFDRLRLVEPIPTPVRVGEPFPLQVEAVDRYGNRVAGYNALVTLTDYTGTLSPTSARFENGLLTLYVTISTPLQGDQIFLDTGTPKGRLATNVFDVVATDLVGSFRVTAPSSVSAGVPFPVTIEALDGSGAPTSRFSGYRVELTTTSNHPISPTVSEPFSMGYVTQMTTLYRAPQAEYIRVSFRGKEGLSGPITVNLGPPAFLRLTPLPDVLIKNESYTVTVTVLDPAGNPLTNYSGSATYYLDKGGVTPGSFTISSGTGSFSFSPTVVTMSNRLIVLAPPLTGYSGFFSVIAIPHHFAILSTDDTPVPSQRSYGAFTVKVEARDAGDQLFPEFLGIVSFSSNPTAPYPDRTGNFVNGVTTHTLWIRGNNNVTTTATLTATFIAPNGSSITGSTQFSLGPKPVLKFTGYPTTVRANQPFPVTLAVYPDASTPVPMENFIDKVRFSVQYPQFSFCSSSNPPISLTPSESPSFGNGTMTITLTIQYNPLFSGNCNLSLGSQFWNSPSPDTTVTITVTPP